MIARPPRRRRARITQFGFREQDQRWVVACACGHSRIERTAAAAKDAKREHDAAHRAIERATGRAPLHPLGGAS